MKQIQINSGINGTIGTVFTLKGLSIKKAEDLIFIIGLLENIKAQCQDKLQKVAEQTRIIGED